MKLRPLRSHTVPILVPKVVPPPGISPSNKKRCRGTPLKSICCSNSCDDPKSSGPASVDQRPLLEHFVEINVEKYNLRMSFFILPLDSTVMFFFFALFPMKTAPMGGSCGMLSFLGIIPGFMADAKKKVTRITAASTWNENKPGGCWMDFLNCSWYIYIYTHRQTYIYIYVLKYKY